MTIMRMASLLVRGSTSVRSFRSAFVGHGADSRSTIIAGLAIVAAQLSVNIGAAFAKSLFPLVGPEGVAAMRTGTAALILIVVVRPWRRALSRRQILWIVLYGLALGGMNLLIYWAFARIPIGVAVAIEIGGPLAVVLLTSRSARDFVWLALAVASVLLLMPWPGRDVPLDLAGIGFAMGAAVCWALYIVFGKRASEVESGTAVALGMTTASLVTIPIGVAAAGSRLLNPAIWGLGLVVALLSSAIPYMLEMKALERLSSRLFGVITSSAPAVAALAGFLMLGERLTPGQWIAILLMIGASAGCSLTSRPAASRLVDEAII
jgi:inner membrane transporter RhtA